MFIFNIDDTISHIPPECGYDKAEPVKYMIDLVNSLYEKKNIIILETERRNEKDRLTKELVKMTFGQVNSWGVKYHKLKFVKKPKDILRVDNDVCHPRDVVENEIILKCLKSQT